MGQQDAPCPALATPLSLIRSWRMWGIAVQGDRGLGYVTAKARLVRQTCRLGAGCAPMRTQVCQDHRSRSLAQNLPSRQLGLVGQSGSTSDEPMESSTSQPALISRIVRAAPGDRSGCCRIRRASSSSCFLSLRFRRLASEIEAWETFLTINDSSSLSATHAHSHR
jgi:hypothetical protein